MYKDYALIAPLLDTQKAYLLKLEDGSWILDQTFVLEQGSDSQYYNIKLTENFAILSGYSDGISFLNFEKY